MKLLKQLYQINSKSGHEAEIKRLVLDQLEGLPLTVVEDDFGNVFITKGQADNYPCVAAHLDEVHQPGVRHLQETDGMIFATDQNGERTGIGADDKNGIWIALRLLHEVETLKVAFFVQEEKDGELSGCRGSRACDLSWFNDVRYILQCDRKGNSDIVSYELVKICNSVLSETDKHDIYCKGKHFLDMKAYGSAIKELEKVRGYKDSDDLISRCGKRT